MRVRTDARRVSAPPSRASCCSSRCSSASRRTSARSRSSIAARASSLKRVRSFCRPFSSTITVGARGARAVEQPRVRVGRAPEELDPLEQVGEVVGAEHDRGEVGAAGLVGGDEVVGERVLRVGLAALERGQPDARAHQVVLRGREVGLAVAHARVEHGEPALGVGQAVARRGDPRGLSAAIASRSCAAVRCCVSIVPVWPTAEWPGTATRTSSAKSAAGTGGGRSWASEGTGGDPRPRATLDPSARAPEILPLQEILQKAYAGRGSRASSIPLLDPSGRSRRNSSAVNATSPSGAAKRKISAIPVP